MKGEKAPAEIVRKAERAVKLAKLILGDDATAKVVEDWSVALMFVPDAELAMMYKRLKPPVRAPRRQAQRKRQVRRLGVHK